MERERMWSVVARFLVVGGAACTELSPETRPVTFDIAQDDAQENLAAIRTLLSHSDAFPASDPPSNEFEHAESTGPSWPPDWLSAFFMSANLSESELALTTLSPSGSSAPLPNTPSSSRSVAKKRIDVRAPAPPSRDIPPELLRQVPAYTFIAPVPLGYPGTMRCAPDFLGGQRCRPE